MSDICSLTLAEVAAALQNKKLSVLEVVTACYTQIDACEPKIQALLAQNRDEALKLAREFDQKGPDSDKPLWGVPITLKDAISTRGLTTTAASRILENFVPIYDAFVVEKLKKAGAIILAKTNMDEFAMGSSTENSAFQKTRNPWNLGNVPGGSSAGSAASVAAGECFASLGSDTGGSIRQPAAFCGCCGLKPTYGRVSRYGLFAFASSLDQIGPLARTVRDCALMLNVIGGHDAHDNTSSPRPMQDFAKDLTDSLSDKPFKDVKVGYPQDFFDSGLSTEVKDACVAAIKTLQNLGAELINIKLPDSDIAIATYYIVAMAEASSNLARYDGVRYGRRAAGVTDLAQLYIKSRSEGFGEEVKRRIMLGSFVLSSGYYDAYFRKAAQTRALIAKQYQAALEQCDVLCLPVAPVTAWPLGKHDANPLQAYLMDAFTIPINLAGLPAISLPVGLGVDTGLPVGLQLVGPEFGEEKILQLAHWLQKALPGIGRPAL